jgi:putative ABC transport system permease protein
MRATWIVARAAVRRRRTQTALIGVIVVLCTAAMLVGLALLAAISGPFDRTFDQLHGAHATAQFDTTVTQDQVAATAHADGVVASAGPFPVAVASLGRQGGRTMGTPVRIAGRSEPDGGVDDLRLTRGRWATGPGEIVLGSHNRFGPGGAFGRTFTLPGAGSVTVVGTAYSVTRTADAWMPPDEVARVGATGSQMLYRFAPASARTAEQLTTRIAAVTAGLPADAVTATASYLTIREQAGKRAKTISAFVTVFAGLSLIVAILVIGNVVSGAVIAGIRSIGVLKAIGFGPGQVTAAYLLMMTGPALIGCVVGAILGNLGTAWMLGQFSTDYLLGLDTLPAPWLTGTVVVAIPLLVALTALVPALRAGRRSAAAALASSSPQTGRGRGVQRRLSRSRLPRAVSLGLALPVVRPARTLLTLVAIVLGSATVVFATGLLTSAQRWDDAISLDGHVQVEVFNPPAGSPGQLEGGGGGDPQGTHLGGTEAIALLRSLPGTRHLTTAIQAQAAVSGMTETVGFSAYSGDSARLGHQMLAGRWFSGAGEAVVGPELLRRTGKSVGDTLTLYVEDKTVRVRIVGEAFGAHAEVFLALTSVPFLDPDHLPSRYLIGLAPGVTAEEYIDGVGDGGLIAGLPERQIDMVPLRIIIGTLTVLLVLVAGLGVAHTVVLNTRERRRDLAIVKAVGMTPGQVVVMAVTSMAALGLIGGILGLPGGIAAQQRIIRLIGDSEDTGLPRSIIDVYTAPALAGLLLCGMAIAVLAALLPARRAARVSTAAALHTE